MGTARLRTDPSVCAEPSAGRPRRDESWRERAQCQGMDTSIFFDIERYSPDRECGTPEENRNQVHLAQFREKVAKRTCQQCVVRPECALYALVSRQPYGIFGGLTPKERRGILRRRKAHRAA